MSKRLQVVLPDEELERFERVAESQGVTLSEWVRTALRLVERDFSIGSAAEKLDTIDQAMKYEFPAPEIEEMLDEIEAGYASNSGYS